MFYVRRRPCLATYSRQISVPPSFPDDNLFNEFIQNSMYAYKYGVMGRGHC